MRNEPGTTEGKGEDKSPCLCPFCDAPVVKMYPFCKDCGKKVSFCGKCGKPLPYGERICPDCRDR